MQTLFFFYNQIAALAITGALLLAGWLAFRLHRYWTLKCRRRWCFRLRVMGDYYCPMCKGAG